MTNRNKIVQGRGRSLIFHFGGKHECFCRIIPDLNSATKSLIKDLLPFLHVWIKRELRNQKELLRITMGCERKERIAEAIIEYYFRAVESLRRSKTNGSLDSFETAFETELRELVISLANSEDELVELNTICVQAIPCNYFDPKFITLPSVELKTIQESMIQTHAGKFFPFIMGKRTA
jgi:hypothetical protein